MQHPVTHTNRGGVRVTVLLRKVHALQVVIADAISLIVPVTMINAMGKMRVLLPASLVSHVIADVKAIILSVLFRVTDAIPVTETVTMSATDVIQTATETVTADAIQGVLHATETATMNVTVV